MPYKAKANSHQREIQPQCTKEQAQEPSYIAVRERRLEEAKKLNLMGDVMASVDDGSEAAKLMKYFMTADPDDMSQGDLSKRVRFLKCEEGGMEEMCEISEKWWREGLQEGLVKGRRQGERRGRRLARREYARETAQTLFQMGMPIEKIAEAVKVNEASVRKWLTVS